MTKKQIPDLQTLKGVTTVSGAANIANVDSSVIRRHLYKQNIYGVRIGKTYLIDVQSLKKYYKMK